MSTSATIAKLNADGSVTGIPCHWYGYLSYVGYILQHYYQDPKKVGQLFKLKSLSSLGANLAPAPVLTKYGRNYRSNPKFKALSRGQQERLEDEFYGTNIFHRPEDTYTIALNRDYHTAPVNIQHWKNVDALTNQFKRGVGDDTYLFAHGKWYAFHVDNFGLQPHLTLKDALTQFSKDSSKAC